MRRRAFTPEAPGQLEGRALLSGVGGRPHGPVPLSGPRFNLNLLMIKGEFQQFSIGGDLTLLRSQLAMRSAAAPFARADGLGRSVNAILAQMEAGLASKAPGAVNTAYNEVVAGVRAQVESHIQDGTVVVVK